MIFENITIVQLSAVSYPHTTIFVECGLLTMYSCRLTHDIVHSEDGDPACGIWVTGNLELDNTHIACTRGPGVKVLRGILTAYNSTLELARMGANIVINGGRVHLHSCIIQKSCGDGISIWNRGILQLHHCSVMDNCGYGVACHTQTFTDFNEDSSFVRNHLGAIMNFSSNPAHAGPSLCRQHARTL